MKRSCGNCDYFEEVRFRGGECRFDPPKTHESGPTRWPNTQRDEWCGRFVAKNSTATGVVVGQPQIQE